MELKLQELKRQMDGEFDESKPAEKPATKSAPKPQDDTWEDEHLKVAGTDKQTMIMSNYPSQTQKDKLKIPYIEKQNGNLCIKCMKSTDTE